MGKYFIDSDFDAFALEKATLEDQAIIADRRIVVERMRVLHEEGLKKFMNSKGLHPHWNEKLNLTNVIYPYMKANAGKVTYLRMGYGKQKSKIDKLSKHLQMYKFNSRGTLVDDMAFHYITQIQIALDENGWNIALYLGKHAWLEQKNLVKKLSMGDNRISFEKLLEELNEEGYTLYLYSEQGDYYYEDIEEYVDDIIEYSNEGVSFTIHIANEREVNDEMNDRDKILDFIKDEFAKLVGIYNFISWDTDNNYIGI